MALLSFDSPCEIAGVLEAPEGKPVPFILVRTKTSDSREKYLLKAGEGVSWEVVCLLLIIIFTNSYLFQKYCLTMCDVEGDMSLAGEGRIKHFKVEKKIIIYSRSVFILTFQQGQVNTFPFQSWTLTQVIFQHLEDKVSWLQFNTVERRLAGMLNRCLDKDVEHLANYSSQKSMKL